MSAAMHSTRASGPFPRSAAHGRGVRAQAVAVVAAAASPTRANVLCWAVIALVIAFELVAVAVLSSGEIYGWEVKLSRFLQGQERLSSLAFDLTSPLTNALSTDFLFPFALFVLVLAGLRYYQAAAMVALTLPVHVLAQFPKALVDRPRPPAQFEGLFGVGGGQSFPSGHVEYAVTLHGFLLYLLLKHVPDLRVRVLLIGVHVMFVVTTAIGRVGAGRHWGADVIASAIVGVGALAGLVWLDRALSARSR